MRRVHSSKPSPAMAVALLALFVALGGTGYAAFKLPKNSVGGKQIKKNAVTGAKVKNRSLTGADIKARTLATVPSARHADNATHANSADHAAPVGPAGGALTGTFPNPTLTCPPGMSRLADVCVENSDRPNANWLNASDTCTAAGRRLGTPSEMWALAARNQDGGWTSTAYEDNTGTVVQSNAVYIYHAGGTDAPRIIGSTSVNTTNRYRCFANLGS